MKKLPYQILYLFVLALGLFLITNALLPPFTKVNQNENAERAMAIAAGSFGLILFLAMVAYRIYLGKDARRVISILRYPLYVLTLGLIIWMFVNYVTGRTELDARHYLMIAAMALIPVTALVEFLLLRIRNNKQNNLQPINE